MQGSLSSAYEDMLTAAQKAKKSLSAWSLATKLTGSHISIASKQKKSTEDSSGEIMSILISSLSYIESF